MLSKLSRILRLLAIASLLLEECNVGLGEALNHKIVKHFLLGTIEAIINILSFGERYLVDLEDVFIELLALFLQENVFDFSSLELLHLWMIMVRLLEKLQNLVNVEASRDGVKITRDHVAIFAEFILNAAAASIDGIVIEVIANDIVVVGSHAVLGASNLVDEDGDHFINEIIDIKLVDHKRMGLIGTRFFLDVTDSQENV